MSSSPLSSSDSSPSPSDDIFKLAFSRCRATLFSSPFQETDESAEENFYTEIERVTGGGLCDDNGRSSNDRWTVTRTKWSDPEPSVTMIVQKSMRWEGRNRLKSLREARRRYRQSSLAERVNYKLAMEVIQNKREHYEHIGRLHFSAVQRRLVQQRDAAERRIRELLYEVIGEYGKREVRVHRRHAYLKYASRVNMVWAVWRLRWERYLTRLCTEVSSPLSLSGSGSGSTSIKCLDGTLLCPRKNLDEIRAVGEMLKVSLLSLLSPDAQGIRVSAVIRLVKKMGHGHRSQLSLQPDTPSFCLASNGEEYDVIISTLRAWMSPAPLRSSISRESTHRPPPPSTPKGGGGSAGRQHKSSEKLPKPCTSDISHCKFRFLSSQSIEWIYPASYYPKFWDGFASQQNTKTAVSSIPSSPLTTETHTEGLDEFMIRYMSQHTSPIACDRIFYCLEERFLALQGPGSYPANKTNSPLGVLDSLESIYVYKEEVSNVSERLTELRFDTNSPQKVTKFCSTHRVCSSQAFGPEASTLRSFPDVIQTITEISTSYHFAPALLFNLPETRAFSGCEFGSDQVRDISSICPHPHLAYLASSQFNPLETLYIMVRSVPGGGVTDDRDNDQVADDQYFMIPLPSSCVRELIFSQLLSATDNTYIPLAAEADLRSTRVGCSSLDLLPDHARKRELSESCQFRHQYALIYGGQQSADKDVDIEKKDSKKKESLGPTYESDLYSGAFYFIQLSGLRDETDISQPQSPRKGGLISEENVTITSTELKSKSFEDELHLKDEKVMNMLLTAYARGLGDTVTLPVSSNDSLKRHQQWQNALLSNICRWRACLCESVDPKKLLCKYHLDMKAFLDSRQRALSKSSSLSSSLLESSKYLPKRPPVLTEQDLEQLTRSVSMQVQYDMDMIKAASTLLMELWDESLKSTVRSYTKRVCEEMSLRRRLDFISHIAMKRRSKKVSKTEISVPAKLVPSNSSYPPIVLRSLPPQKKPIWHQWVNQEELSACLDRIYAAQNHVDNILRIEKSISIEIEELVRLGIFPSFEITMIRKDVKKYKELEEEVMNVESDSSIQGGLETAEIRLCERKLSLLRARKEDELEIRAKEQRRARKMAMMEHHQQNSEYQMRF